jgi:hypothetical protein
MSKLVVSATPYQDNLKNIERAKKLLQDRRFSEKFTITWKSGESQNEIEINVGRKQPVQTKRGIFKFIDREIWVPRIAKLILHHELGRNLFLFGTADENTLLIEYFSELFEKWHYEGFDGEFKYINTFVLTPVEVEIKYGYNPEILQEND